MSYEIAFRTTVPILLLIFLGYLSRKTGLLKKGDERVFSTYVYYFALPSLFLVDLSEIDFTWKHVEFILAGIMPIFIISVIYVLIRLALRLSRNTLYLLMLTTVFGSTAFYGIPFLMFAFPNIIEHLATLAAASISAVGVSISILLLELYRLETPSLTKSLKILGIRLSKNPLILSVLIGFLLSLVNIDIPSPLSTMLRMLGNTTATVAIFLLGTLLYGKKCVRLKESIGLSLLRIIFLPTISLFISLWIGLPFLERTVLIVMHSVPLAVSMIILSDRYNFYREIISSVV
ncbi:MAG: AEC family transporter, partial [Crenarchaeota archaeon]|nr:AEC family transporter [Thermoproteota archaeon]MDW8033634.1 AEC family transporter [Nitrososphaerota archaeon]